MTKKKAQDWNEDANECERGQPHGRLIGIQFDSQIREESDLLSDSRCVCVKSDSSDEKQTEKGTPKKSEAKILETLRDDYVLVGKNGNSDLTSQKLVSYFPNNV